MPKTRQQTKGKMTRKGKQPPKATQKRPMRRSAKVAKKNTIESNQSSKVRERTPFANRMIHAQFDLNTDMWTTLFTSSQHSVSTHIEAQERDAFKYLATMRVMKRNGVTVLDGKSYERNSKRMYLLQCAKCVHWSPRGVATTDSSPRRSLATRPSSALWRC